MRCSQVSECWRGARPRSPGCDQAGAHRVLLTSGAQLLPDLWRERWNTMVTWITAHNSHNPQLCFRFCSSPCFSPVVMARNIQLRWTFAFFQKYVTMMMMLEIDPISQTAWFSTKLFVRIYLGIIQLQFLLMMHGLCIKSLPSEKKNVCFDEWTHERSMEETFLR